MPDDYDPWQNTPPQKSAPNHAIGQNIDSLSIAELNERIVSLKLEIVRLEEAKSAKEVSAKQASAFFKI